MAALHRPEPAIRLAALDASVRTAEHRFVLGGLFVKSFRGRVVAAFVAVVFAAGHAFAAPGAACEHAPEIAAFADVLLARPHGLLSMDAGIPDVESAYAKIKYGGLGRDEAHALINSLPARNVDDANRSLELYVVKVDTPAERLEALDPQVDADFRSSLLQSVGYIRAVALDGNLAFLVEAAKRDPDFGRYPELMTYFFGFAFSGIDDPTKTKLAAQLEEMGLPSTAATVLASEDDIQPWLRYVREHPRSYPADHRLAYWFARDGGPQLRSLGFNGLAASLSLGIADKDVLDMMADKEVLAYPFGQWFRHRIRSADISSDPLLFLFQQIEEGEVDASDTDAVTIAFLSNLDATIGRQKRDRFLAKARFIDLHLVSQAADWFPLPDYFDTALARRALLPYLTSRTSAPPERPEAMSAGFPWDLWVEAAGEIRDGDKPDGDIYIAAELLQLSGRGLDSAALLLQRARAGIDLPFLTAHTTKMMASLMRACGDETMGLDTTSPLYRFDAR